MSSRPRLESEVPPHRPALLLLDPAATVVAVSEGYVRATGRQRSELVGRCLLDLPPYAGTSKAADHLREAHEALTSATSSQSVPLTDAQPCATGVLFEHAASTPVLDQTGRVLHLVHMLEVAGSVRSERLALALRGARAIGWEWDVRSDGQSVSNEYAEYFRLDAATVSGHPATAGVHPDDHEEVLRALNQALTTGDDFSVEFRGVPLPDGVTRFYSSHGQVLCDAHGEPSRIAGVTWDVTERRQLRDERALLQYRIQEGQKLESLGVLAGGIAHDFNNILMAILGNASLLRRELGHSRRALGYVDQIEEASRRASDLCKQMLAYAGKGRFVLAAASVNQLIEETAHLLQVSISKKALLRFHLYPDLPLVMVDVTQIRQVLMNLVINASDAIGERSGVISINTGVVRADRTYLDNTFLAPEIEEGDYVYLEVSDTGGGMTPETRSRIFEPFFSTKFPGRGLGLAAVLGIVQGHRGALKVYTELGRGSSFKLLLPIAREQSLRSTPGSALIETLRGGGTILVVDDEETLRAVVAHMLEALGFRVLLAAHGREALAVYRDCGSEIDGVMLDLTMPHLDGEETFRELRRLNPDVRVLLMSGYNEQEASARFVGKGLAGFIQKPFNLDDLQLKLRTLVRTPRPA